MMYGEGYDLYTYLDHLLDNNDHGFGPEEPSSVGKTTQVVTFLSQSLPPSLPSFLTLQ